MTKTSRYKELVLGSFLVPEIDMIFGDGVGASRVSATLPNRQVCFSWAWKTFVSNKRVA